MSKREISHDEGGMFSVNDFCHWACIGRTKVYAEMKSGRLSAKKIGSRTVIPRTEAQRWASELLSQKIH